MQAICDRLGPGAFGVFFQNWMSRRPLPLTEHDRGAGYWWELSMRHVEASRTLVFDAPAASLKPSSRTVSTRPWSPRQRGVDLPRAAPPGKADKLDCVAGVFPLNESNQF